MRRRRWRTTAGSVALCLALTGCAAGAPGSPDTPDTPGSPDPPETVAGEDAGDGSPAGDGGPSEGDPDRASRPSAVPPSPGDVAAAGTSERVNVVILVGDGLGAGAREAARLASKGRDGALAMDRLRYAGWARTGSADRRSAVTDSAAAATALAGGVRTRNRSVGIDARGNRVPSLLDAARRLGKATGLVTTSEVTDATPAAFGAHARDRKQHRKIARHYVRQSEPDVVLGGGARRWSDARLAEAEREGWELVTSRRQLKASSSRKVLGLFAERRLFDRGTEGKGSYEPPVPLRAMTRAALEILSADDDGFFLVVEEEAIDEMAHANNARLTIAATRAFDRTVRLVHRFAKRNPGTLVVVVGDHETGGMAVERAPNSGERGGRLDGPFDVAGSDLEFFVDWTGAGHSGAATPLNAFGPGAERLARSQHLTDVHDVVLDVLRGRP